MVFDNAYQVVGFLGGCMFPIASGFQTIKVFRTRSAKDISYAWQAVFGLAHVLYLIYSLHFGLWVIYSTQLADMAIALVMVCAKVYFDFFYRPKEKVEDDEPAQT